MKNSLTQINSKKILVVDDDEGILDAMRAMFESEDYTVDTNSDGEIFENLEKNLPDVILLDVLLSGKDGREICSKLKENASTKSVPVIMISADPVAIKGIKACGADDFVEKPFEMKTLLERVKKYIGKA